MSLRTQWDKGGLTPVTSACWRPSRSSNANASNFVHGEGTFASKGAHAPQVQSETVRFLDRRTGSAVPWSRKATNHHSGEWTRRMRWTRGPASFLLDLE
eukprot:1051281-Prorocentrum_minimum.AAC.1